MSGYIAVEEPETPVYAKTTNSYSVRSSVVEMKHALPGRMGMLYSKAKFKAQIQMLDHVIRRLEAHIDLINQKSLQSDSPSIPCGMWVIPTSLYQIYNEFKSAHPFIREVISCLDKDVRKTIGDVIPEERNEESEASWSPIGARMEALWLEGLAKHNDKRYPFKPQQDKSEFSCLSDAVETLRKLSGKKKFNNEVSSKEWDADSLKIAIEKTLMTPNKNMEWWGKCSMARAFTIGLADLWKREDYKAVLFILREAERLHESRTKQDQAHHNDLPFAWTTAPVKIASIHIGKFGGDSDSYAAFANRLNDVRDCTLPLFLSELHGYRASIQEKVDATNSMQLQFLTGCAACLNAGLVNIFRYFTEDATRIGLVSEAMSNVPMMHNISEALKSHSASK